MFEQNLTITHRDGSTLLLSSAGSNPVAITQLQQHIELNAADTVQLTVKSTHPLPIAIGDTINIYGDTYTLQLLPQTTKTADRQYQYQCTFEGYHYLLINALWLLPFSVANTSYAGTLQDFADRLVENLNRVHAPNAIWQVGTIMPNTPLKVLTYQDVTCLAVLQDLCTQYGAEFRILHPSPSSYILDIVPSIGDTISYPFAYGHIGGLSQIRSDGTDDPDFATRIFFYGGSTNIPSSYFLNRQSSRLCLRYRQHGPIQQPDPTSGQSYIEMPAAVQAYGLTERVKTFDDIYPNRKGTVSAIDTTDPCKFADNTLDFDLNATDPQGNTLYLIPGTTPHIHFNSGQLAGYDFDIVSYNHATHTFTIAPFRDENDYEYPATDNNAFRIAVGDEYIITDIIMPQSYITAAENQLQTAAEQWYQEHSAPAVEYNVSVEQLFCRRLVATLGVTDHKPFHVGDRITLTDTPLGINGLQLRIMAITRDLLQDYAYDLTVALTDTIRARYQWKYNKKRFIHNTAGTFTVSERLRQSISTLGTSTNNLTEGQRRAIANINAMLITEQRLQNAQRELQETVDEQGQQQSTIEQSVDQVSDRISRTIADQDIWNGATTKFIERQAAGISSLEQRVQRLEQLIPK